MKLTILSEAQALDGFLSEHGLSFLLEIDGMRILFDTGASDIFLRNAQKLGLDLSAVDQVVLSHGHWDHGNGLEHLEGLPLLTHPGSFRRRYRKGGEENIGINMDRSAVEERFSLEVSTDAVRISEHLWFLGEVPRINDFEARYTKYQLEDGSEDFISDDSGLACMTEKGLVVISGCAHSGICNMVEHARELTFSANVHGVLGGFHLKILNHQLEQSLSYFDELAPSAIYPSHCTMDQALDAFYQQFGERVLKAGMILEF